MLRRLRRQLCAARVLLALLAVLFAAAPISDAFACGAEVAVPPSLECVQSDPGPDVADETGHVSHGGCQHGHCHHTNATVRGGAGLNDGLAKRPPSQLPLGSVAMSSLPPSGLKRPPKG